MTDGGTVLWFWFGLVADLARDDGSLATAGVAATVNPLRGLARVVVADFGL